MSKKNQTYLYEDQKPFSYTQGFPFPQPKIQQPKTNPYRQSQASKRTYHEHLHDKSRILLSDSNSRSRVHSRSGSASQVVSTQLKTQDVIKGNSRIEYVPYERKVIQYETQNIVERVPITKKVIQYEERRVIQNVPKEVIRQQYMAIERRVQYRQQIVPQRKIQMVSVPKTIKRFQYVPIEKQIVHYPKGIDQNLVQGQSRMILRNQGIEVKQDAEFKPIDPTLLYKYSDRPQSRYKHIGYVQQGTSRIFSNSHIEFDKEPNLKGSFINKPQALKTFDDRVRKVDSYKDLPLNDAPQYQSYRVNDNQNTAIMRPFESITQSYYQQGTNYNKFNVPRIDFSKTPLSSSHARQIAN